MTDGLERRVRWAFEYIYVIVYVLAVLITLSAVLLTYYYAYPHH